MVLHCGVCKVMVSRLCVAWRKASRKIWRLSPRTHCDILPLLSDCVPLDISLKQRFMKFIQKAFNHTFSPLETISISLWASLHHHFPVLSVFSHVSCQFVFSHIFSVVVSPSQSRSPPSSLPRYDHVHHFS